MRYNMMGEFVKWEILDTRFMNTEQNEGLVINKTECERDEIVAHWCSEQYSLIVN